MKKSTHYLFSLGLTNLYGFLAIHDLFYSWIVIIFSIFCGFWSITPNFLDHRMIVKSDNMVLIDRNRHPLTHSPWTTLYFLPFSYLAGKLSLIALQIIIDLLIISWVSHLILDSLNPGGLPLGRKSVFSNHPVKHYQYKNDNPNKIRSLRLARIPFNDQKANHNLSYVGLFLFSLNLTSNVIYSILG